MTWFFHDWNIGWNWVDVYLEIPFFKYVDCFEILTSQLFFIANYLTGFCIVRLLTERSGFDLTF